ncbi:MAG: sigma-70 family RNA polymerase sigma factor [Patescibacteria group bacterium]
MNFTDQELVARYLAGDKPSFDMLVARYLKLVYSVMLHYTKNAEDAEDLTQDAFVKVLKHLRRYDSAQAFKPWLMRIAKNHALDWLKKKKPVSMSELDPETQDMILNELPDPAPLQDAQLETIERARVLTVAMGELNPEQQKVLFLRYMKDFSFKEIAEELGELMNTAKSRHQRALIALKKILLKKPQLSEK